MASHTIASDIIAELGELHYGRRKIQPAASSVREFQQRAKEVLRFPLKKLDLHEIGVVGQGLGEAIAERRYTCYACAVMPDHVHLLIRKHRHQAEEMIENSQNASRLRLRTAGARTPDHPTWGGPGWRVFLDHPTVIRRTVRYIENNPVKWKLPRQRWPFVVQYDGWPLHPGHNPNSPYARRLRNYRG